MRLSRWKLHVPFYYSGTQGTGIVAIVYCRSDQSPETILRQYLTARGDRRLPYLDFDSLRGNEIARVGSWPKGLRVWVEGSY